MDQERTGKRMLLAMLSQGTGEEDGDGVLSEEFSVHGILLAIGSILTLVIVIAMCACKDGDSKDKSHTNGTSNDVADDGNVRAKPEPSPQTTDPVVENGNGNGLASSNRSSASMSKHSRQASSTSGNNIRPTSTNLRELPEPPVDSHHHSHHSRNTSSSGVVVLPPPPPPSASTTGGVGVGGGLSNSSKKEELEKNGSAAAPSVALNLSGAQFGDPDSNGYDHFGPKTLETPPGYDQLGNVKIGRISDDSAQDKKPTPEMGGDREGGKEEAGSRHHHYAQPKERTYDVVKDVKRESLQLYHADSFSQLKEEDPYNQIGESDNTVSNAMIKRIRQSMDPDDLYATIQGDSDGSFALVAAQEAALSNGKQSASNNGNGAIGAGANSGGGGTGTKPSDPSFIPPTTSSSPSTPPGDEDDPEEDVEYAVVNKPIGGGAVGTPTRNLQSKKAVDSNDDDGSSISPYNTYRPPEPPRKYGHYAEAGAVGDLISNLNAGGDRDEDEDWYEDGDLKSSGAKEHTYSKVSARESLASMSARYALNPYETVPDMPENMYATVEGGSGDGVVPEVTMRHRLDRTSANENRLSQNSDTYAEIGVSGGGLTTSVISNTSTSSATNNSNNNNSSTILGTSSGSSSVGGAPIPPSLDSLHQMTKSQTSSEGDRLSDRLSDRYLASPDDWIMPGQLEGIGGSSGGGQHNGHSQNHHHHYHRADGSDEESYSTLTRASGAAESSSHDTSNGSSGNRSSTGRMPAAVGGIINGRQGTVTDVESGEVTPIPSNNYETVEDGVGNSGGRFVFRGARGNDGETGRLLLDTEENDPNYESVDETRAKVALLKARESANFSPPTSPTYATPHEFRRNQISNASSSGGSSGAGARSPSSVQSPPLPAPHVSVVNIFQKEKDETEKNGLNLNSTSSSSSSPPVVTDRSQQRRRRPNHDYEEVDLSPPLSPQRAHEPRLHQPEQSLSTSATAAESSVDPAVRERVLNSHTYEELPQVKLSKKDEKRKSDRAKKQHSSASTSEDKKKSKEEKKKSKTDEKKKASGTGEGSSGAGASWDGSKKSDSWETNRTRL